MLDDLYQELILDHGKKPRNFGPLPMATHEAEGYNPFCGDQVHVRLVVENEVITDLKFEGCGCAISTASASLMSQAVTGRTVEEARELFARFRRAVVEEEDGGEELGALVALAGVRNFPNRIKCAILAWHAMNQALDAPVGESPSQVTTESPSA